MADNQNLGAERENFSTFHRWWIGQIQSGNVDRRLSEVFAFEIWQAARRSPADASAPVELPPLPTALVRIESDDDSTWGQIQDDAWALDQLIGLGLDAPLFTVEQYRQGQREAVAADRRARPKREMPPEMKAAIEEAHRTGATSALLPNGDAVFINYGEQPEDISHLNCTACGGSGHIEDQRDIAGRAQNVSAAEIDDMALGYCPSGKIGELREFAHALLVRASPPEIPDGSIQPPQQATCKPALQVARAAPAASIVDDLEFRGHLRRFREEGHDPDEARDALIAHIDARLTEARSSREITEILNNPPLGNPDSYSRMYTALTNELELATKFGKRENWFAAVRGLIDWLQTDVADGNDQQKEGA